MFWIYLNKSLVAKFYSNWLRKHAKYRIYVVNQLQTEQNIIRRKEWNESCYVWG